MRALYDLYQTLQPHPDNGVNISARGRITRTHAVTPKRRRVVLVADEPLSLAELYAHPDCKPLKDGWVPVGLLKSGELVQATWEGMTTGGITGFRNWGKSTILKALTLHAFHARAQGFNCQIAGIDPHAGLPGALFTYFRPVLRQFDQAFAGHDPLDDGRVVAYLESLEAEARQAQRTGFRADTPWRIIVIDEADVLLSSRCGKDAYRVLVALINLRKFRLFVLLSWADTTKQGSGGHGTGLVSASSTVFCTRYNVDKARRMLSGPGEAAKVANLRLSWAAVKIPPRAPGEESKLQIVKMPLVTPLDLEPFQERSSEALRRS